MSSKKGRTCKAVPCRKASEDPEGTADMLNPRQMRELHLGLRAEQADVSGDGGEAKARLGIIVENLATLKREKAALIEKVNRQKDIAEQHVAAIEESYLKAAIDNRERVKEMTKLRLAIEQEIKEKPRMKSELGTILDLIKNQATIHQKLQAQRQKLIQSFKGNPNPNVNCSVSAPPQQRPVNLPLPGPNQLRGGRPALEEAANQRYMDQFQPTGPPNQYRYLPTQGAGKAPRPYQLFDGRLGPQVIACPLPPYVQNQLRNIQQAESRVDESRDDASHPDPTNSEQIAESDESPEEEETASTSDLEL